MASGGLGLTEIASVNFPKDANYNKTSFKWVNEKYWRQFRNRKGNRSGQVQLPREPPKMAAVLLRWSKGKTFRFPWTNIFVYAKVALN